MKINNSRLDRPFYYKYIYKKLGLNPKLDKRRYKKKGQKKSKKEREDDLLRGYRVTIVM